MRIEFKNEESQKMVGILNRKGRNIAILVHAFLSEKTARGKYTMLAEELGKHNISTFLFDFTGYGESADNEINVAQQHKELKTVVNLILEKGFQKIALVGSSLGGLISFQMRDPHIKTMVLWAPVSSSAEYEKEDKLSKEQMEELSNKGYVTLTVPGIDKKYKVSKQFYSERASISQKELLKDLKIPIFIIHGDADELVPLQNSQDAMKLLSKESKLLIIPKLRHSFGPIAERAVKETTEWIVEHL